MVGHMQEKQSFAYLKIQILCNKSEQDPRNERLDE